MGACATVRRGERLCSQHHPVVHMKSAAYTFLIAVIPIDTKPSVTMWVVCCACGKLLMLSHVPSQLPGASR